MTLWKNCSLEPTGKECRTSLTPEEEATLLEEEATLLEEEHKPLESLEAAASLPECLKTPKSAEATEQINNLSTAAPSSPTPKFCHHSSQKAKKSWWGIEANSSLTSGWIQSYIDKNKRVPNWWREFQSILCSRDEPCTNIKVKEIVHQQAAALRLPSSQLDKEWLAEHSTMLRCVEEKGLHSPEGIPRSLRLPSDAKRRNGVAGHGPSKMCHLIWNPPRVLCRAVQEFHRCLTPSGLSRAIC